MLIFFTLRALRSLHIRVARRVSCWLPWCQNVKWEYPPIGEALVDTGMVTIGEYITHCHNIMAQQIDT